MGQTVLPPVPGLSYRREVFLSSTTFTLPMSNIGKFDCVLVSGGSGGGTAGTSTGRSFGGTGSASYFHDIVCNPGTTLTITIGAGGTGTVTLNVNGGNGTATTITGITGNGAATTLSSGAAVGGAAGNNKPEQNLGNTSGWTRAIGYGRPIGMSAGFGFGMVGLASGQRDARGDLNQNIFGGTNVKEILTGSGQPIRSFSGSTGGPIPLLGSMLHANVGTSGAASALMSGGTSTANTYFAGSGGGSYYTTVSAGVGGGGGGGAPTNSGAGGSGGLGGNGAANSGGGGGGGGVRQSLYSSSGLGGNGGSGFAIIGYWG